MPQFTKEQTDRVNKARDAIDAICDEYNVDMVPQIMIVAGQIVNHSIGLMPKQEESRIIKPQMRKDVESKILSNPKGGS